ncbi:phage holin family protein [uncultured Tyzzerella sp.]|uniref:phage holin family protein n=1 Tax=uncultured Tyzzerella sp. TaxID=2321398 RepID=UPI002943A828|nr:phage holin family protein [uncultured Tyzzerella sp.]
MNIFESKIKYFISCITGILSAILGDFWFLFVFLLGLNIIDYTTGILKARYLKIESSRRAMKGFIKKFLIWCLVAMGFGLGIAFEMIGEVIGINLHIMLAIGWFILAHCIINEFRSILENIVELDKGYLVPKWLIKGLEVTHKIMDKRVNDILDNIDEKDSN